MKRPLLTSFCFLLFASLASSIEAQALKVTFSPVFEGDLAGPTRVTVSNRGSARRAEIISPGGRSTTIYPLELPAASVKEVIVAEADEYSYQPLRFVSGRFSVEEPYGMGSPAVSRAAVIHDEPGSITRFKAAAPLLKIQWAMFPCLPEDAPARAAAFSGYKAVWLGGGSERLSDAQTAALKAYVIGGGNLIFSGGTHAGALKDPRWTELLGLRAEGLTNRTVKFLPEFPPVTFGSVSLAGQAWPQKHFDGLGFSRPFGAGRILVLSCSFFDQSFESALVTSRLCAKTLLVAKSPSPSHRLRSDLHTDRASTTAPGPPIPTTTGSLPAQDAFTYTPPEAGSLFAAVWVFALILAPLAILVPRLLKRAELAWVLAPLTAIGMAVFVMAGQGALRSMKLSQQTSGRLFIQEGVNTSILYAKSDIFIPRAGGYDFNMPPSEMLTLEGGTSQFGSGSGTVYDVGTIVVPPIAAKNLEFRTLRYQSILEGMGSWLTVKRVGKTSKLEVTNRSPYELTQLRVGDAKPEGGAVAPGRSLALEAAGAKGTIPVIHFVVTGLDVGPKLGRDRQTILGSFQLARSPW